MTCPDENVFAQIQSGGLSPSELADFHLHLDSCPACLELASILGCIQDDDHGNAPSDVAISQSNFVNAVGNHKSSSRPSRNLLSQTHVLLIAAQCVALLCHAYSSIVLVPLLWAAFRADVPPIHGILGPWPMHYIWLPFVLLWGTVGFIVACVVLTITFAARRFSRIAVRSYALITLPTIFLTPMAACLLLASRRRNLR